MNLSVKNIFFCYTFTILLVGVTSYIIQRSHGAVSLTFYYSEHSIGNGSTNILEMLSLSSDRGRGIVMLDMLPLQFLVMLLVLTFPSAVRRFANEDISRFKVFLFGTALASIAGAETAFNWFSYNGGWDGIGQMFYFGGLIFALALFTILKKKESQTIKSNI